MDENRYYFEAPMGEGVVVRVVAATLPVAVVVTDLDGMNPRAVFSGGEAATKVMAVVKAALAAAIAHPPER